MAKPLKILKSVSGSAAEWCCKFWHRNRWNKLLTILVTIAALLIAAMYGISQWYIHSQAGKPLEQGVSFIPDYARSLGLDPQDTMDALLGINVRHYRLVSYWSDMERTPGQYDFSQLDWQFKKAEASHSKVILTLGLRQPRWPECHAPDWVDLGQPASKWQPQLESFMKAVINRYKASPSLQSYQLENEYFLKGFGICPDSTMTRQRLIDECQLVKKTDPGHPVIIGRSNNSIGLPLGQPRPDRFSISIYKRVWDASVTKRYFEYPWPAWYYGFIAGSQELVTGKNMIAGELQAEAWPPNGQTIQQTSLAEQNKSLNARRLADRFVYGRSTGMRQIYLWGGEYWYYRKVVLNDPSLWNIARQEFSANH